MKTMMLVVLAVCMSIGCVHEQSGSGYVPWRVRPITGPDGKKNWSVVSCVESKANCFEAAAATCPNGYTVVDNTDHTTSSQTSRGATAFSNGMFGGNAFSRSRSDNEEHYRQEWLVHCNSVDPRPTPTTPDHSSEDDDPFSRK